MEIYETYDKPCGEIFLTAIGDFEIVCTACETKFIGFPDYEAHFRACHIKKEYEEGYLEDYDDEVENQSSISARKVTDDASLASADDLNEFEELEFLAPEPDDCKEIEEFVEAMNCNTSDQDTIQYNDNPNTRTVRRRNFKKKVETNLGNAYKCPYCDATSHSRKSMNEHKQRHKGVFRHKCHICEKSFFSTTELNIHLRTHTGERPYLCSDCGHKSATASALKCHINSCRDIRESQCQVCNKMFRSEMYLRRHMVSHSDERKFACNVCHQRFKQKKTLQSHAKIHENEHSYKCDMCPASFNQRPGLYSHIRSKHKQSKTAT